MWKDKLNKKTRSIEEISFDLKSKIVISFTFSIIWLFLLALVTPGSIWLAISLPLFGFLYHKLFNLIDAEVLPKDHLFIFNPGTGNKNHKFVFEKTDTTTNTTREFHLNIMKHRSELDKMSPVQVFIGDGNDSLELFNRVLGQDIHSLTISSLSELQVATTDLKFLYIDTSNISESEMKEISKRIKKINDRKVLTKE
ncbi:hypothetical protein [Enterococcus raffinosus]|uniref:hypothetical protein n=1 Tax=Enterococcus raffinosus TaxID=71452 RepID=UPI003ACC7F3F